jgi:hypothetical protein
MEKDLDETIEKIIAKAELLIRMNTPIEFKKTQESSDIGILNLAKSFSGL